MTEQERGRVGRKADRQWFREAWTPEDIGAIYRAGVRHDSELNRKWAQFAARVIHGYE